MKRFQIILLSIIVIMMGGIVILFVLQSKTSQKLKQLIENSQDNIEYNPNNSNVSDSKVNLIIQDKATEASISGLIDRIEKLEQDSEKNVAPIIQQVSTTSFQPQVIYLGSSNTTNRDWEDSGVEVSLNKSDYPSGVKITFQAGLSIIGGEAWARLKNNTTGAVISISEVFHSGSTTTWKSSPEFELHNGNNIYIVELRSTSGETVDLAGARLILSK